MGFVAGSAAAEVHRPPSVPWLWHAAKTDAVSRDDTMFSWFAMTVLSPVFLEVAVRVMV